jgi:hypothetical protein
MFHHQNAASSHSIATANKKYNKLKYLMTTESNQNYIHEEMKKNFSSSLFLHIPLLRWPNFNNFLRHCIVTKSDDL